jgi:hypothetical protein
MAHDSERRLRVAEGPGDLSGGDVLHEEGTQRFILPLLRALGLKEEAARFYYVFRCSYSHIRTLSHSLIAVNFFILFSSIADIPMKYWIFKRLLVLDFEALYQK